MKNMHYSKEQWRQYIQRLIPDQDAEHMDNHLYACDICLEIYMECLEHASQLPSMIPMTEWNDQVMEMISAISLPDSSAKVHCRKLRGILYHPAFHYAVAAVITLLLMSTGMFQQLVDQVQRMDAAAVSERVEEQSSISQQLMEKTLQALNTIQRK
jgi:hypothetical protein